MVEAPTCKRMSVGGHACGAKSIVTCIVDSCKLPLCMKHAADHGCTGGNEEVEEGPLKRRGGRVPGRLEAGDDGEEQGGGGGGEAEDRAGDGEEEVEEEPLKRKGGRVPGRLEASDDEAQQGEGSGGNAEAGAVQGGGHPEDSGEDDAPSRRRVRRHASEDSAEEEEEEGVGGGGKPQIRRKNKKRSGEQDEEGGGGGGSRDGGGEEGGGAGGIFRGESDESEEEGGGPAVPKRAAVQNRGGGRRAKTPPRAPRRGVGGVRAPGSQRSRGARSGGLRYVESDDDEEEEEEEEEEEDEDDIINDDTSESGSSETGEEEDSDDDFHALSSQDQLQHVVNIVGSSAAGGRGGGAGGSGGGECDDEPDDGVDFEPLSENSKAGHHQVNMTLLHDVIRPGVDCLIQSDYKTGKTFEVERFLASTQERVCVVVHLKTLKGVVMERFEKNFDLLSYDDPKFKEKFREGRKSIVITLDSLLMLDTIDFRAANFTVFIDEFKSVLTYAFRSETLQQKRMPVLLKLMEMLRGCKQFICADNDISDVEVKFLRTIIQRPRPPCDFVINIHRSYKDVRAVEMPSVEGMVEEMYRRLVLREKFTVSCNTRSQAEQVWKRVRDLCEDGGVVDKNVMQLWTSLTGPVIEDVDALWLDVCPVFSPILVCGVSFQPAEKRCHFSFIKTPWTLSPEEAAQQLTRNRNPNIVYWHTESLTVPAGSQVYRSEAEVEGACVRGHASVAVMGSFRNVRDTFLSDDGSLIGLGITAFTRMLVKIEFRRQEQTRGYRFWFLKIMVNKGFKVEESEVESQGFDRRLERSLSKAVLEQRRVEEDAFVQGLPASALSLLSPLPRFLQDAVRRAKILNVPHTIAAFTQFKDFLFDEEWFKFHRNFRGAMHETEAAADIFNEHRIGNRAFKAFQDDVSRIPIIIDVFEKCFPRGRAAPARIREQLLHVWSDDEDDDDEEEERDAMWADDEEDNDGEEEEGDAMWADDEDDNDGEEEEGRVGLPGFEYLLELDIVAGPDQAREDVSEDCMGLWVQLNKGNKKSKSPPKNTKELLKSIMKTCKQVFGDFFEVKRPRTRRGGTDVSSIRYIATEKWRAKHLDLIKLSAWSGGWTSLDPVLRERYKLNAVPL